MQLYNDWQVDEIVKKNNEGEVNVKPAPSKLWADLAVLNKPEVYKNYNKIINSKYTSNDNLDKLIIKNKANKDLNRIVEAEVERISKNLDYAEQVIQKYDVPMQMYEEFKKEQAKNSVASRQQVLKDVAIKANDLLVSDGLNIPSVYSYRNVEVTAESLLRQSQMGSKHEEINAINNNYRSQGKNEIYMGKEWIWTHGGKTTRHRSNHLQKRQVNEPFIVVNDKTLHIDEMMYPSDPAGSFSNAFICYCECQYLTGDETDLKQLGSLSLNQTNYKVKSPVFMTAKEHTKQYKENLKKPLTVDVDQPVGTNVKDYMNVTVADNITPSLIDDSVDGVTAIPFNYEIDGSKVNVVYNDGSYYYNGLALKEYDVQTKIGIVSKSAVTKHNNNIKTNDDNIVEDKTTKASPIDLDEIDYTYYENGDEYWLDENNGAFINDKGVWEYNGLEAYTDGGNNSFGKFKKQDILEHNKQFETTDNDKIINKPLNVNELEPAMLKGEYLLPKDFEGDISIAGYEYNSKGEDVKVVTLDAINEYNKQFNQSENDIEIIPAQHENKLNDELVTGEPIDTDSSELMYFDDYDEYMVNKHHLSENNGKFYYKGLDVTDYMSYSKNYADIPKKVIDEHNSKFGIEPNESENNENVVDIPNKEPIYIDDDSYYYNEDNKELTIYDMNIVEVNGKKYHKGLDVTEYYNNEHGWADVPEEVIKEHNKLDKSVITQDDTKYYSNHFKKYVIDVKDAQEINGEYYYKGMNVTEYKVNDNDIVILEKDIDKHNKKVAGIEDEPISKNDLVYAPEDGGYLTETWNLKKVNDKYYYKGLEVQVTDDDKTYQLIPIKDLEEHNKQFETIENNSVDDDGFKPIVTTKDYIHRKESKVLSYGEDIDDQAYAVDKKSGKQYVIDNKRKYEERQDNLQAQVDMTDQYNAVNDWGYGGYRKINHFNYNKKTYEDDVYRRLRDELVPILDEIRVNLSKGKSINALEDKYNTVIKKFIDNGEIRKHDGVLDTIKEIRDIDEAMVKSPALQQDTCFIRAGAWSLDFNKIGEVFEWEGYAGISYKERPVDLGHESLSYNITILAPKGSKGVRLSKQFNGITPEREWLLPRGQKFRVLEFDEANNTCTIELIIDESWS